jgi:hypothetical protein
MASKVVSDRSDSLSPAAVAELEAMGLHRAGAARARGLDPPAGRPEIPKRAILRARRAQRGLG